MATTAAPGAAPADDSDFIDQIDAGKAAVVSPGGDVRTVAVADLPKGAKEGDYVRGGQVVPPPAEATEGNEIRAKLAAGDQGGDIKLDDNAPAAAPGPTVQSPLGQIPANTPGLPAPTDDLGAAEPGAAPAAPGPADDFIDATIAKPAIGAPPEAAAPPTIPPLGPDGLPASSADLQQRLINAQEGEKKGLEGVAEAQQEGREKLTAAHDQLKDLRDQQAAELAAEQLYVRDRQAALDAEDAANLQKARDQVIPQFWEGREGQLVGAAITAALSGAAAALMGSTHNAALEAITHNVDAYYTRERQKIDSMYKYAEQKGLLDDKARARYAGELTDLMQNHAYTLQAAADRVTQVGEEAKGLVDQAQTNYLKSQLEAKSVQELQAARGIDEKNYDAKTKREIAEADMLKAQAAMAKVHKGKGGGGGASGTDWMAAAQAAAQQPGATELTVAKAARDAGFRGKDTTLKGFAQTEIANVGKQVGDTEKQMKDLETQLNGSGGKLGPAAQLGRIQAMKQVVGAAVASGDPDRIKAAMTQIKEEAGGMLSGGKTTAYTGRMLDEAQSVLDHLQANWSKIKGNPTEGAHFVSAVTKLLGGVEQEKLSEVHEIRQKGVEQMLGPGGVANSPAAKAHAMARFKGITGSIKDANGNPVYQEGGAAAPAAAPSGPQWKPIPRAMAGNPALKGKKEVLVSPDGSITDAR